MSNLANGTECTERGDSDGHLTEEDQLLSQIQKQKHSQEKRSKGKRGRKKNPKSADDSTPKKLAAVATVLTVDTTALQTVVNSPTNNDESIKPMSKTLPVNSRVDSQEKPDDDSTAEINDSPLIADGDTSCRNSKHFKPRKIKLTSPHHMRKSSKQRHNKLPCSAPVNTTNSLVLGKRACKESAALKIQHIKHEMTAGSPLTEDFQSILDIKSELLRNEELGDDEQPSCSKFKSKKERMLKSAADRFDVHNSPTQNRKDDHSLFLDDEARLKIRDIKQENPPELHDSTTKPQTLKSIKKEMGDTKDTGVGGSVVVTSVDTTPGIAGLLFYCR